MCVDAFGHEDTAVIDQPRARSSISSVVELIRSHGLACCGIDDLDAFRFELVGTISHHDVQEEVVTIVM